MNNIEYIRKRLSREDLLCQLAEECAELGKAALKLCRVYAKRNPTPVKEHEAYSNLLEEIADVFLCFEVLEMDTPTVHRDIQNTMKMKTERWSKRLKATCPVCGGYINQFAKECPNCRVSRFDPDNFMGEYENE